MSSKCRLLRTGFGFARAKLLIGKGVATVADGRQVRFGSSDPDNRNKRQKAQVDSACRENATLAFARKQHGTRSDPAAFWEGRTGPQNAFDFAYCRPFPTLHRGIYLPYTEVRIVMTLTVRRKPYRHTNGLLASHQDTQGAGYDQAIAKQQGRNCQEDIARRGAFCSGCEHCRVRWKR